MNSEKSKWLEWLGACSSVLGIIGFFMQFPPVVSLALILVLSISVSILSIRMAFSSPPRLLAPVSVLALGMMLVICLYAGIYTLVSSGPDAEFGIGRSYFDALYFSVMTWTTVGYGDFTPITPISKIVAASEALLGYIFMGVFWGVLVAYITQTARERKD